MRARSGGTSSRQQCVRVLQQATHAPSRARLRHEKKSNINHTTSVVGTRVARVARARGAVGIFAMLLASAHAALRAARVTGDLLSLACSLRSVDGRCCCCVGRHLGRGFCVIKLDNVVSDNLGGTRTRACITCETSGVCVTLSQCCILERASSSYEQRGTCESVLHAHCCRCAVDLTAL